jgi:hypothetical protein
MGEILDESSGTHVVAERIGNGKIVVVGVLGVTSPSAACASG